MSQLIFHRALAKPFLLVMLGVALFSHAAIAGVDSYQIYLNGKLIIKQLVNQPLSVSSLQLDKANSNDVLSFITAIAVP
jgi:hypothetical protein